MMKHEYANVTIVTAERGNFLKLVGVDNSEELIGRPERILLNNTGKVPEFEEAPLESVQVEEVVEEKPAKKTRKSTKK